MSDQLKEFLRLKQVIDRVALSRAQIYEAMSCGRFPKAYPLGKLSKRSKKEHGHAVRWLSSDIDRWIGERTGAAQ